MISVANECSNRGESSRPVPGKLDGIWHQDHGTWVMRRRAQYRSVEGPGQQVQHKGASSDHLERKRNAHKQLVWADHGRFELPLFQGCRGAVISIARIVGSCAEVNAS